MSANGFDFTWPDSPPGTKDNVASRGETIRISGRGNALAFLGTGTSLSAAEKATVHYTDGTSSTGTLRTETGQGDRRGHAAGNAAVHVFAMTLGDEEIVPPALADGQLTTSAVGATASRKWVVTRNEHDGSYQLKNAGTGLCADVAYSSKTSGDPVVECTCTGTSNQRWVIATDGAALKVSAKHSGLSLAAGTNGLVVQQTDTAATSQRWRATPNQAYPVALLTWPHEPRDAVTEDGGEQCDQAVAVRWCSALSSC